MTRERPDWTEHVGHVVVCGLHDEGLRLVEQLHAAGVAVMVVDAAPDPRLPEQLEALGVPWLDRDSGREDSLRRAGVGGAVALVCVESDDLATVATALLGRELRPDLRVVAALRNAAVGQALTEVGVLVLDTAALSAPSIVESCLQRDVHAFEVGDHRFLTARAEVTAETTLRAAYGDLAPLLLVREDGGRELSPGRDTVVGPGDCVVLAGPAAAVEGTGLAGQAPEPVRYVGARAGRAPAGPRRVGLVRFLLREADRRLKAVVLATAGLAVVSVVVLMLGYRGPAGDRMSVVDAAYFTVETMATVGFGDFYFREQDVWLRVWAIVLMVLGATLVASFFALLTDALVSRSVSRGLGRSLLGRRITGMEDHVVVVGAGSIGLAAVSRLVVSGVDVVVLESDEQNRYLDRLHALGVPVVVGDATVADTWRRARLSRAKAVAVLTSDDLVNLEVGLVLRGLLEERWSRVPVVVRAFDRRLTRTLSGSFGFEHVRSPADLTAPWFVGAALGLDVVTTLYAAGQTLLVATLPVRAGSGLVGRTVADLPVGSRVVALTRSDGSVLDLPRRDARFGAGDRATLAGSYEDLLLLLRQAG